MSDTHQNRLLVIGTGMPVYRTYLIESLATAYRVHLFLAAEPEWESSFVDGWTVLPNTHDSLDLITEALALHAVEPFAGVLCWDEASILAAAEVAQALGLPGGDPEAIRNCRDKHLTRQALAAAGLPQPRSIAVSTVDEASAAADACGYPVVLKPRALGGSLGVIRVDAAGELATAFAFARDTRVPEVGAVDVPVLVEEFLTGPEISVDAAVHDGRVTALFVAHKEIGYAPYCEEIGHHVDAADPLLDDAQFLDHLQRVHDAIGLTDGMTHTEFMLTPAGPVVVEVNGRLGGDLIPYLGLLATGVDPALVAADISCGRTPRIAPDRKRVAAVRFYYVDEANRTVESMAVDAEALPPAVDRLVPIAEPGFIVSPPPEGTMTGRLAYGTAVADTAKQARTTLLGLAGRVTATWR